MRPNRFKRMTLPSLAIIAIFSIVGFLATNISPVLLGGLYGEGRVDLAQIGRIGTMEFIALGLSSLLAPRFIAMKSISGIAIIAALINLAAGIISIFLQGDALIIGRIMAGLSAGVLISLIYELMSRSPNPSRLMGFVCSTFLIAAALTTVLASNILIPKFGVTGLFVFLAVLSAICAIMSLFSPAELGFETIEKGKATVTGKITLIAFIILANSFLFNAFSNLVWVYWEPIATYCGASKSASDSASAISLAFQLAGVLFSSWLSPRLPLFVSLIVVHIIAVSTVLMIFTGVGEIGFYIFASIFGAMIYIAPPFLVLLAKKTDPHGRTIALLPGPTILGAGFGPLLASLVVSEKDMTGGVNIALVLAAMALAAIIAAMVLVTKERTNGARLVVRNSSTVMK